MRGRRRNHSRSPRRRLLVPGETTLLVFLAAATRTGIVASGLHGFLLGKATRQNRPHCIALVITVRSSHPARPLWKGCGQLMVPFPTGDRKGRIDKQNGEKGLFGGNSRHHRAGRGQRVSRDRGRGAFGRPDRGMSDGRGSDRPTGRSGSGASERRGEVGRVERLLEPCKMNSSNGRGFRLIAPTSGGLYRARPVGDPGSPHGRTTWGGVSASSRPGRSASSLSASTSAPLASAA